MRCTRCCAGVVVAVVAHSTEPNEPVCRACIRPGEELLRFPAVVALLPAYSPAVILKAKYGRNKTY